MIEPRVALHLAQHKMSVPGEHQLVAPTLLGSQLLSMLYRAVQRGEMSKADADRHLDYVRGLRIRLLGDRVLLAVAWKVADQLGWVDTWRSMQEVARIAIAQYVSDRPQRLLSAIQRVSTEDRELLERLSK